MKQAHIAILGFLFLGALIAMMAYFVSNPQYRLTKKDAERFYEAALPGTAFYDALKAGPQYQSITFGACGRLASTTNSTKKGLVFSPPVGAYEWFSDYPEFLGHNPKLFADHEDCRKVSVQYMNGYVDKGEVTVDVDGQGVIQSRREPVTFN